MSEHLGDPINGSPEQTDPDTQVFEIANFDTGGSNLSLVKSMKNVIAEKLTDARDGKIEILIGTLELKFRKTWVTLNPPKDPNPFATAMPVRRIVITWENQTAMPTTDQEQLVGEVNSIIDKVIYGWLR